MRNKIKIKYIVGVLIGIFSLFQYSVFVSVSFASDIMIIGNKDVPISSLSTNEIRSIFLGEKIKWFNNQKITFVILKTALHEDFLKQYVGNTPAQYRNYWRKMVFTGKSKSPKSFKTSEELINYVSNTSGAIGYIPSEAYNDNVKIISVR